MRSAICNRYPPTPQLEHSECKPITYPPPQPPLTTDILTSLALTSTNHAENQEVHLRLPPGAEARREHIRRNVDEYAGLLGRACPAQVYEYVDAEETSPASTSSVGSSGESGGEGSESGDSRVEDVTASGKKFVINSQVSLFSSRSGPSLVGFWMDMDGRRTKICKMQSCISSQLQGSYCCALAWTWFDGRARHFCVN